MSDLFWLSEAQVERLKPFFPNSRGKPRVDDRRVLSGIIFRAPRFLTIFAGAQRCVWREAGEGQLVGCVVPWDGLGATPFTPGLSGRAA